MPYFEVLAHNNAGESVVMETMCLTQETSAFETPNSVEIPVTFNETVKKSKASQVQAKNPHQKKSH
jgi:hypothetical protein